MKKGFMVFLLVLIVPFISAANIAVSPTSLDFNVELGESLTQNLFLINYGEEEADYEISVKDFDSWFDFDSPVNVDAENNKKIDISITPDELGEFETIIYIKMFSSNESSGGASAGVSTGVGVKARIVVREKMEELEQPSENNGGNDNSGGGGSDGSSTNTNLNNSSNSTLNKTLNLDLLGMDNKNNESEEIDIKSLSRITGSIIGFVKSRKRIVGTIFVVLIIGSVIFINIEKRMKKKEINEIMFEE